MHDDIKRFYLEGKIGDVNLIEAKERHVQFLEQAARDEGYIPLLDLEPQFTLSYQPDEEVYDFSLSVYGVPAGEEACEKAAGMMNGKMLMKYIPKAKSNQS